MTFNIARITTFAIDAIIGQFIERSDKEIESRSQNVNAELSNNIETISFSTNQRELMEEIDRTKTGPTYYASDVEMKWARCLSETIQQSVVSKINNLSSIIANIDDASKNILDIYIKCDKYLLRPDMSTAGQKKIEEYKRHLANHRMQYRCIEGEIKIMIEGLQQYHKSLSM